MSGRGIPLSPHGDWRCPRSELRPVETVVSRLERVSPFCARQFRPDYLRPTETERRTDP